MMTLILYPMTLLFPQKQQSATLKKCGAFDDNQKGGAFDVKRPALLKLICFQIQTCKSDSQCQITISYLMISMMMVLCVTKSQYVKGNAVRAMY